MSEKLTKLKELQELKNSGVLSDEEFETLKAELLQIKDHKTLTLQNKPSTSAEQRSEINESTTQIQKTWWQVNKKAISLVTSFAIVLCYWIFKPEIKTFIFPKNNTQQENSIPDEINYSTQCANNKEAYINGYNIGKMSGTLSSTSDCQEFVDEYNRKLGRNVLSTSECFCAGFNDGYNGKVQLFSENESADSESSVAEYSSQSSTYNSENYDLRNSDEDETSAISENRAVFYKNEKYIFPFKESVLFSALSDWVENQSIRNGRYVIPSYKQLRDLYEKDQEAGTGYLKNNERYIAKMNPVFDMVGSAAWFWVSDENFNGRCCINMFTGGLIRCKETPSYPVHALLIWKED